MAKESAPFRSTLREQERSRTVRAAMESHRSVIADSARALYQSVLREGETFDWDLFQELNLRLMGEAYEQLVTADQAQRVDKANKAAAKKLLDGKAGEVRRHIRGDKNSFAGSYGEAVLPLLGFDGALDRKPLTLLGQGRFVVVKLRDTTIVLPAPVSESRALDRAEIAGDLESDLDELERVLNQTEQERKEIQKSRAARHETTRFFKRRHVNLTRVFEAYLRLLGLDDLADRLRSPAPRRSTRSDGEDADETPTDPASDPVTEPATETP